MTDPYDLPIAAPPPPEAWDEITLHYWRGHYADLFAPMLRKIEQNAGPALCQRAECRRARRCRLVDCAAPLPPRQRLALDSTRIRLRQMDAEHRHRVHSDPIWTMKLKTKGKSALRR